MRFDDDVLKGAARDNIAKIVIDRLRRANKFKCNDIIHQGKSFYDLSVRASMQYRREYTCEDKFKIQENFKTEATRYYGLTQIKVNATRAWKRDLVLNNFDSMMTVFPTPEPELDDESVKRVRIQAERRLLQLVSERGLHDLSMVFDENGKPYDGFEEFIRDQVVNLRKMEQARLKSLSLGAAERAKTRLTDMLVQSNFRQTYGSFSHDQILYGIGFMKFPDYRRVQTIKHSGRSVKPTYEVMPMFRHVPVFNMFPVGDGADLQTNTAVIEVSKISKIGLINLMNQDGYLEDEIKKVLDDFDPYTTTTDFESFTSIPSRNWLGIDSINLDPNDSNDNYWGSDDTIDILIHEGYLTGYDLNKAGITGYHSTDVVNATIVIAGGRTIRCTVNKAPMGFERSYFGVPFNRFGTNYWDVLGMGAMLYDTEYRINAILCMYEHNMNWASRPPLLSDVSLFRDVVSPDEITPGEVYEINNDAYKERVTDPLRPMAAVSAQYQLLYAQISQLLRQADEECGIPAFAYSAQDFGKASLGEYSQRMSNALRTIKDAALEEDNWLIEPAFEGMFNRIMQEDKEMAVGQDVKLQVRGLTGLLKDDIEKSAKQSVLGTLLTISQRPGLVSEETLQYAVRDFLADNGFPVDILGYDDPTIKLAVAESASSAGMTTPAAGNLVTQQVPQVDGRSGPIAQGAVANANGTINY